MFSTWGKSLKTKGLRLVSPLFIQTRRKSAPGRGHRPGDVRVEMCSLLLGQSVHMRVR